MITPRTFSKKVTNSLSPPATIINPSATRKYIQSNHPVQDRSLIPSRLQAVKQSLLDAAQRAIDLERKDAEMEDVMEADQIRKMEEERRDRFERSKYIGSWINETLRHTSTRYTPYSTTFATPPISKVSRASFLLFKRTKLTHSSLSAFSKVYTYTSSEFYYSTSIHIHNAGSNFPSNSNCW